MPRYKHVKELLAEYKKRKAAIKKRLAEFRELHKGKDDDIFQELCFCILTPQSKAVYCDKAIRELRSSGLLLAGHEGRIRDTLKGRARFHNKKAAYIVGAREIFRKGECINIKNILDLKDPMAAR